MAGSLKRPACHKVQDKFRNIQMAEEGDLDKKGPCSQRLGSQVTAGVTGRRL